MRQYSVYILLCSDGRLYTGITNDVAARLSQHQGGTHPECYTYNRRPVRLVYASSFQYFHDAIAWEKRIKRWSRRKKQALIDGRYDDLPVLASVKCERITMVRQAHHDRVIGMIGRLTIAV